MKSIIFIAKMLIFALGYGFLEGKWPGIVMLPFIMMLNAEVMSIYIILHTTSEAYYFYFAQKYIIKGYTKNTSNVNMENVIGNFYISQAYFIDKWAAVFEWQMRYGFKQVDWWKDISN